MDREKIIKIAETICREQNWSLMEPIVVMKKKEYIFWGKDLIYLISNADKKGCNVRITIDAQSGEVLFKGRAPR